MTRIGIEREHAVGGYHGVAAGAAGGAMGGGEAMAVIGIGTASRASVEDVLAVVAAAREDECRGSV